MAQFDVYHNKNPNSKRVYPYLMDVQVELLDDLKTRVVIPLARAGPSNNRPIQNLTPVITMGKESFLLLTPQLAGIPASDLGRFVVNVSSDREAVVNALDFLFTGI